MNAATRGMILHVDDEPLVLRTLAMVLEGDGYSVSGAASGPEALRLAGRGLRPDVLIVDFNLDPQMNGAEVAEELRLILGYAPPIILLSGDPSNAECPWVVDTPIWLARKPINPLLLLAAMPSLVELSRSTRGLTGSRPWGILARG